MQLRDVRSFHAQDFNGVPHRGQRVAELVSQRRQELVLAPVGLFQCRLGLLVLGDVSADNHILARFSLLVEERHDGGVHPVEGAVLGAVLDFPLPHTALRDRRPQVADEFLRMEAGVDDAVVLSQQFFSRILRDRTELVVHERDPAPRIGDGYDRVLVERGSQLGDLFERSVQRRVGPLQFRRPIGDFPLQLVGVPFLLQGVAD